MKICLYGYNLTNVILANILAKKKISIDIIKTKISSYKRTSRTLALSFSNFQYLNKIINRSGFYSWDSKSIKIFTENSYENEIIEFKNRNNISFKLVLYSEIFELFSKNLQTNKYIKVLKKDDNFSLDLNKYDLVINTSNKSKFFKEHFSKKIFKDYSSIAYSCMIHHQSFNNYVSSQYFTEKGPLAFLPYSKYKTSIVYSYNGKRNLKSLDIQKIVNKYNPKLNVKKLMNLEEFKIKHITLRNYYFKNILCFGDLIHQVHPLAGQGFNMTLRDIRVLSELIDERKNLGLEINTEVITDFEKKRKHLNYIFASGIDFIYEFFKFDNSIKNAFSKPIFKILNQNLVLKKYASYFSDKGIDINLL